MNNYSVRNKFFLNTIPLTFSSVAPSHPQQIPLSSLQQVERLICPSSQGDLPAIKALQIEPQWIHLFQQKAAAARGVLN
jgi:hypothetical protein